MLNMYRLKNVSCSTCIVFNVYRNIFKRLGWMVDERTVAQLYVLIKYRNVRLVDDQLQEKDR